MTETQLQTAQPENEFQMGLWISIALHLVFVAVLFWGAKRATDPEKLTPVLPTLRVDLVGLPDQLKSEMVNPAPYVPRKEEISREKNTPKIHQPPVPSDAMKIPSKNKKETKKDTSKRMKNALERIKALSKIQEEVTESQAVKGNQISKGSSLSANAQTSTTPSYAEHVRERLQSYWALPPWIARQKLSAQVEVEINAAGMVSRLQFLRPSGNQQFDNEVKKTIQASQPFNPPEGGNSAKIVVGFPL